MIEALHSKNVVCFSVIVATAVDCAAFPAVIPRPQSIIHTFGYFCQTKIAQIFCDFNNSCGGRLLLAKELQEKLRMYKCAVSDCRNKILKHDTIGEERPKTKNQMTR